VGAVSLKKKDEVREGGGGETEKEMRHSHIRVEESDVEDK